LKLSGTGAKNKAGTFSAPAASVLGTVLPSGSEALMMAWTDGRKLPARRRPKGRGRRSEGVEKGGQLLTQPGVSTHHDITLDGRSPSNRPDCHVQTVTR